MKGIVFTLDAIFALVVATASLSILLYFSFNAPSATVLSYNTGQPILTMLLTTNLTSVPGSAVAAQMLAKEAAGNESWQQSGNGGTSGAAYGPQTSAIAYQYSPDTTVGTGVVAGYGMVYFATADRIYALNASFGSLAWSVATPTPVVSTPALYDGMLVYANDTDMVAINAHNGSQVWSASLAAVPSTPVLAYDGYVLVGAQNNNVIALNAVNGTQGWSIGVGGTPTDLAVGSGVVAARTSASITTITFQDDTPELLNSSAFSTTSASVAVYRGMVDFGNGTYVDMIPVSEVRTDGFTANVGTQVTGVAAYGGRVVYQSSDLVTAYSTNLIAPLHLLWNSTMPSYLGDAYASSTPSIGGGVVYTLWSNGWLAAQNSSSGSLLWATQFSYPLAQDQMPLAYGNLYLSASNSIVALGACSSGGQSSLLGISTSLYLNGQGGCATSLINAMSPMYNYSLFIDGTFAPGIDSANFTKGSILLGNNDTIETNAYSWSMWIDPSSWPGAGDGVMAENCASAGCPYMIEQSSQDLQFSDDDGAVGHTVIAPISLDTWQDVVGTYNYSTGTIAIYLNGVEIASANSLPATPRAQGFNMSLGMFNAIATTNSLYYGKMADVQIYSTALTKAQVLQVYDAGIQGAPLPGVVAWYPLEGTADDYGQFSNTGYVQGNVTFVASSYLPKDFVNAFSISKAGATVPLGSGIYDVGVYTWR